MSDLDDQWRYEEEYELPDPIKVRKDHQCDNCSGIINKGELAVFQSGRAPRYETDESHGDVFGEGEQVGVEYWKSYIHEDSSICDKNNKQGEL